jgi:hypothetical protein
VIIYSKIFSKIRQTTPRHHGYGELSWTMKIASAANMPSCAAI